MKSSKYLAKLHDLEANLEEQAVCPTTDCGGKLELPEQEPYAESFPPQLQQVYEGLEHLSPVHGDEVPFAEHDVASPQ